MTRGRLLHGPGDWLVTHTSAKTRRSVAMWMFIVYVLTVPLRYPFKDAVWMIYMLSELALALALLAVAAAETPVEDEHGSS
jgi:hypothetical protein